MLQFQKLWLVILGLIEYFLSIQRILLNIMNMMKRMGVLNDVSI